MRTKRAKLQSEIDEASGFWPQLKTQSMRQHHNNMSSSHSVGNLTAWMLTLRAMLTTPQSTNLEDIFDDTNNTEADHAAVYRNFVNLEETLGKLVKARMPEPHSLAPTQWVKLGKTRPPQLQEPQGLGLQPLGKLGSDKVRPLGPTRGTLREIHRWRSVIHPIQHMYCKSAPVIHEGMEMPF